MFFADRSYERLGREGRFEFRQYQPHVVLEHRVSGDRDPQDATRESFWTLLKFLKGRHRLTSGEFEDSQQWLQRQRKHLPMPVRVLRSRSDDDWLITFVMKNRITLDDIPEPDRNDIQARLTGNRLVAAVSYAGTWTEREYERQADRLWAWLHENSLVSVGEPEFARYCSPLMPPPLRKNEVMIPLASCPVEAGILTRIAAATGYWAE